MNSNSFSGPIHQPSPHPTANVSKICSLTPLTGVLYLGCTLAKARGSEPDRAMPNQTRVAALLPAMAAAIMELSKASSTITQAPPQYLRARTKVGFSGELMKPGSLSVPQPTNNPHEPRTRKTPITKIEIRIALRKGFGGDFRFPRQAVQLTPSH